MMVDPRLDHDLGKGRKLSESGVLRLRAFASLVQKWNPAINIVGRSSIDDIWQRHIIDSVQVFTCALPEHRRWLDMGSGGGFPGFVVAILAAEFLPDLRVILVESDKRKCVFLSEASRQLGIAVSVHADRIEALAPQHACVISARALAPLSGLCAYAAPHLREGGICVFPKGASFEAEIADARKTWKFDVEQVESVTESRSSVLILRGLKHV